MAEIIFILIFAVPAILGLAEIIHTFKLWLVSSESGGKRVLILVPDNEGFAKQILGAYEELRWHGSKFAEKIVVLDDLLDDENKIECKAITDKLNLEISGLSELSDVIIRGGENSG